MISISSISEGGSHYALIQNLNIKFLNRTGLENAQRSY